LRTSVDACIVPLKPLIDRPVDKHRTRSRFRAFNPKVRAGCADHEVAQRQSGAEAMANPEHLELLRQGVEAWNAWRRGNRSTFPDVPDLSGTNLGKTNLQEANLRRVDLRNTNLGSLLQNY